MQLFLDMDGVLADFDRGYEEAFGVKCSKETDTVDWGLVHTFENFYSCLPPMRDMRELWDGVAHLKPIVLTGVPMSVPEAVPQKVRWVRKHVDPDLKVVTCASRLKCRYLEPGDILIDDWEKYRHLWESAGGRWITHVSAKQSLTELNVLLQELAP